MLPVHRRFARFLSPLLPLRCYIAGAATAARTRIAATEAFPRDDEGRTLQVHGRHKFLWRIGITPSHTYGYGLA